MPPEAKKFLWDAWRAAGRILKFVEGRSFDDYLVDDLLRSGVVRQFEIVGEALGCLARMDSAWSTKISDLPRIVAFRNRLIHGYSRVDDALVWGIIVRNLPDLKMVLERELDVEP